MRYTFATYNVHRCIGNDGRFDPERIAAVLRELKADIIALQELETRHEGGLQLLELMSRATGLAAVAGPNILRDTGHFGNALLARAEVLAVRRADLSYGLNEPRDAIGVELNMAGRALQVHATHLGLTPQERRYQIKRLLELMATGPARLALLGDINEWLPWARPLRWLHRRLGRAPALPTFPAALPLFALDRIWMNPREDLLDIAVHNSYLARTASDHLPLKALVEL